MSSDARAEIDLFELFSITPSYTQIVFVPGALVEVPFTRLSILTVRYVSGGDTLEQTFPELGLVTNITQPGPPGTPNFRFEGPWSIFSTNPTPVKSQQQTQQDLEAHAFIDTALYLQEVGQLDAEPLLGQGHRTFFPPEAERSLDGVTTGSFSNWGGQYGFYFPTPGMEPQFQLPAADALTMSIYQSEANPSPSHRYPIDMDLPQAWAITRGSAEVVVAVIDTGVDWLHSDFYDGIAPTEWTYEQHMLSTNAPRIYRSPTEVPGVGGDPGASGTEGIDDDGDGWIDEDPTGLVPGNTPEEDVVRGVVLSANGNRVYADLDPGQLWTPGALVGLEFVVSGGLRYAGERIVANGENWVETTLYPPSDHGFYGWVIQTYPNAQPPMTGWESFVSAGGAFTISDLRDSDGDYVVDDDWAYDPSDDDENGVHDDFRGAAFPLMGGTTAAAVASNDQRPSARHGTQVASLLSAGESPGGTGMVGVAPLITIVPIKYSAVRIIPDLHASLARSIDYALSLKRSDGSPAVNIINLTVGYTDEFTVLPAEWSCENFLRRDSGGHYLDPLAGALLRATEAGVLVVNAAGNQDETLDQAFFTSCFEDVLIVGGHKGNNVPSQNMTGGDINSTFYPRVDVLAWSVNLPTAVMCEESGGGCNYRWGLQSPSGINQWGDGTSWAAPQVAGVAALMLSANPHLGTSELKAKLLASTTPVIFTDGTQAAELEGKVGSGVLNAFRALTIYGAVSSTAADTTWANTVWVSGDINVPAGKTLIIEPGTTVKIGQDDLLDTGYESRQVEWVIDGSLVAVGTPEAPIVFEVFASAGDPPTFNPDQEWAGIRMLASENVVLENVIIHDLRALPRDAVSSEIAFAASPGEVRTITWTTTQEITNPLVRVRTSVDGGATFDTGTTAAVTAGSLTWTAPSVSVGTDVVVRVEFVDPDDYVLGFDDLTVTMLEQFAGFTNTSDATGLTLPYGSQPYASAPLDFDDDGAEDLLISFGARRASLNRNSALVGEAPEFNNVASLQLHDGQLANTRGIATADFNGDGLVDVFIADANTISPSNLLLAGSSTGLDSLQSARLNAAASLASTGASFGDFDGDGWLDLYVLSDSAGSGDRLMRLDSSDTTFVDVTFDAGLRTDMTNSTSVAWADVNLDGRMDLMVGWGMATGSNGEWSPLYINQGPDTNGQVTFADKADPAAGTPWIDLVGHVQSMVFADITGDRKLDLIVATDEPSAANTLLAFVNDGTGTFTLADPSLGVQSQLPLGDVAVTDFDGNGVLDILAVPKTQADVLLLTGHGDAAHRVFHDRTMSAGLGSELARGITLADFNRDTDADIFLLREELSADPGPEDKRFFWSNDLVDAASPPSTPKAITIGFAREPGPNNYNTMGIGARVAVAVTKPGGTVLRSVQVVDGGTGRGSQGSGRLVFGLAGQSTAEITVRWPHGQTQVFDAASFTTTFPHITLTDTSDPEIQSSTVTASYIPSSGYTTHTYSWKSTYPGGYPQVLVTTGNKPASCLVPLGGVNQLLLTESSSGVSVTSEPVDGGWLHTVTWIAYCADSCTYTYYARNVVGGQVYSSSPKTLNVSVCADITE